MVSKPRHGLLLACIILLCTAIGLTVSYASPATSSLKRSGALQARGPVSSGATIIANTQLLSAGAQRLRLLRVPGIADLYARCDPKGQTSFTLTITASATTLVRLDTSARPQPPKLLSPRTQLSTQAARRSGATWQVAPVTAASADSVVILTSATSSGSGCAVAATGIVKRQARNAQTGTG